MRNFSDEIVVPEASGYLDEDAAPELLSTLRQATRELHERVEATLQSPDGWTVARYAAMLQAFHQVIAPVEPRLCALLGSVFVPPPPVSRAERIRSDLAALGRETVALAVEPRLRLESQADAYGIGYVLQGSLLGGAVIVKQMRAGGADQPVPTGYLEMYGQGLAGAWKRFCHAANSFGRQIRDDERQRATQAATDTFRAFECALARIP